MPRLLRLFSAVREGFSDPSVLRFYSGRVSEGFHEEELEIADRCVSPGDSLLLVGGGGGRDATAWAQRGNQLTVTDLSEPMVRSGREHLRQLRAQHNYAVSNAVALSFREHVFDHVVFCDGVYSHIPGRELRLQALRDAAHLLKQGFLVVYAGWLRPSILPALPGSFQRLRVWKQWLSGNLSAREPGDARLRRLIAEKKLSRPCFYHYFQSADEIESELRQSGLRLVDRTVGIWALKP